MIAHENISDDVAVISLSGEVDVYTAPRAREVFIAAVNSGRHALVLDLRNTEYLDSTGLGVITGALKRCRSRDGNAVIVVGQLRIFRIFAITGLHRVFRLFNDVPAAIEAVSSRDYNRNDPPGPHECKIPMGWFSLVIYTSDFDERLRLRGSLLTALKEFAIELVFLFPDNNASDLSECLLVLSEPVALDDQIKAFCDAIERDADDSAVRDLTATLKATHDVTIQLGSTALIAHANGGIATTTFMNREDLADFWRKHTFRDSKRIVRALKSIRARKSIRGR